MLNRKNGDQALVQEKEVEANEGCSKDKLGVSFIIFFSQVYK